MTGCFLGLDGWQGHQQCHRCCLCAVACVLDVQLTTLFPARACAPTCNTLLQEQPKPSASAALAECSTLFAYLQLVVGFACPLLLLAAQEARIYAVNASTPPAEPQYQPSNGGAQAAAGQERSCRAWGRDAV